MGKHAYLIMAHNEFDLLSKLIEELDYPLNDIYIHVDRKAKGFNEYELNTHGKYSKIFYVDRMPIIWGGESQIKCEIELFRAAVKGEYQYYHLISGHDYPIRSQREIHDFFDQNSGKEFIEYWDRDRKKYEYRIRYYYPFQEKIGRYTNDFKTLCFRIISKIFVAVQVIGRVNRIQEYGKEIRIGAQWVSITHPMVKYLLDNEQIIKQIFFKGVAADELFVQTLCWNSPYIKNIYPGGNLRLIDWKRGAPYVWQEKDFQEIVDSKCLFVRKVSSSNRLIEMIHEYIDRNGSI